MKNDNYLCFVMISEKIILNCNVGFEFMCPKTWGRLDVTEKESVRYCNGCERNVYYCLTVDDVRVHAKAGNCVAFEYETRAFLGELNAKFILQEVIK
ncbi:MAG: hypothetical protein OEY11_12855 [Gammaproteobacteria bacterium]|nr:hypothetical protein [Gammaproteobacteria bacterium]